MVSNEAVLHRTHDFEVVVTSERKLPDPVLCELLYSFHCASDKSERKSLMTILPRLAIKLKQRECAPGKVRTIRQSSTLLQRRASKVET